MSTLRLGTRGSALATSQSEQVAARLRAAGRACELVRVRTAGDVLTGPLAVIGGTGVFVTSLRDALSRGEVDLAVHSLKDLPTAPAPGIALAAVPPREDAADVLCSRDGRTLADLPAGARIGTGSPRRRAQLLAMRPDLLVEPIRGNVDTRLRMVHDGTLDAVVLAAAGLQRLDRGAEITERIPAAQMLPAPGQGALAVECRADDLDLLTALADLDDPPTRAAVAAEREFLRVLEAGCIAPVGALAQVTAGALGLTGAVFAVDGTAAIRGSVRGGTGNAGALGAELAGDLLDRGAGALLGAAR